MAQRDDTSKNKTTNKHHSTCSKIRVRNPKSVKATKTTNTGSYRRQVIDLRHAVFIQNGGGNQLEDVSIQPFWVFCLAFLTSRNTGINQQCLILLFLAKLQFATSYRGSGTRLTIKHIHFPGSFLWEPYCGFDCRWSPSRHADSQTLVITVSASGLNPCSPYRRLVRQEAQAPTHSLGTGLPRPFLLPQDISAICEPKKKKKKNNRLI